MQPQPILHYLCAYGGTNIYKELQLDSNSLTIKSGETVHLQIRLPEINSAVFSANYMKLSTSFGNHVIRGIKPHDHSPAISRYSLSDSESLKKVREFLEAMGVKTSFQLFVIDKKILIFLISFVILVACIALVLR